MAARKISEGYATRYVVRCVHFRRPESTTGEKVFLVFDIHSPLFCSSGYQGAIELRPNHVVLDDGSETYFNDLKTWFADKGLTDRDWRVAPSVLAEWPVASRYLSLAKDREFEQ